MCDLAGEEIDGATVLTTDAVALPTVDLQIEGCNAASIGATYRDDLEWEIGGIDGWAIGWGVNWINGSRGVIGMAGQNDCGVWFIGKLFMRAGSLCWIDWLEIVDAPVELTNGCLEGLSRRNSLTLYCSWF